MKRKRERERDEETARVQADRRQENLLAQLKAQEEATRAPSPLPTEDAATAEPTESTPDVE